MYPGKIWTESGWRLVIGDNQRVQNGPSVEPVETARCCQLALSPACQALSQGCIPLLCAAECALCLASEGLAAVWLVRTTR